MLPINSAVGCSFCPKVSANLDSTIKKYIWYISIKTLTGHVHLHDSWKKNINPSPKNQYGMKILYVTDCPTEQLIDWSMKEKLITSNQSDAEFWDQSTNLVMVILLKWNAVSISHSAFYLYIDSTTPENHLFKSHYFHFYNQ